MLIMSFPDIVILPRATRLILSVHFQAQPHCTSPVVVFRYRAVPSANKEHSMLSSQQQTEEQDPGKEVWHGTNVQ